MSKTKINKITALGILILFLSSSFFLIFSSALEENQSSLQSESDEPYINITLDKILANARKAKWDLTIESNFDITKVVVYFKSTDPNGNWNIEDWDRTWFHIVKPEDWNGEVMNLPLHIFTDGSTELGIKAKMVVEHIINGETEEYEYMMEDIDLTDSPDVTNSNSIIFIHGYDDDKNLYDGNYYADDRFQTDNYYETRHKINIYGENDDGNYDDNGNLGCTNQWGGKDKEVPIQEIGKRLRDLIRERARLSQSSSKFMHNKIDIICHSMGGLVVRSMIKEYYNDIQGYENSADKELQIRHIFMIATPSDGHIYSEKLVIAGTILLKNDKQSRQMVTDSSFLDWLGKDLLHSTDSHITGKIEYFTIAGVKTWEDMWGEEHDSDCPILGKWYGEDYDGIVAKDSVHSPNNKADKKTYRGSHSEHGDLVESGSIMDWIWNKIKKDHPDNIDPTINIQFFDGNYYQSSATAYDNNAGKVRIYCDDAHAQASEIDYVRIDIDGINYLSQYYSHAQELTFIYDIPNTQMKSIPVYVRCVDEDGNSATKTSIITIIDDDVTPPTLIGDPFINDDYKIVLTATHNNPIESQQGYVIEGYFLNSNDEIENINSITYEFDNEITTHLIDIPFPKTTDWTFNFELSDRDSDRLDDASSQTYIIEYEGSDETPPLIEWDYEGDTTSQYFYGTDANSGELLINAYDDESEIQIFTINDVDYLGENNIILEIPNSLGEQIYSIYVENEFGLSDSKDLIINIEDDDTTPPTVNYTYYSGDYTDNNAGFMIINAYDESGIDGESSVQVEFDKYILDTPQSFSISFKDADLDRGEEDQLETLYEGSITISDDDSDAPVINAYYTEDITNYLDCLYIQIEAVDYSGINDIFLEYNDEIYTLASVSNALYEIYLPLDYNLGTQKFKIIATDGDSDRIVGGFNIDSMTTEQEFEFYMQDRIIFDMTSTLNDLSFTLENGYVLATYTISLFPNLNYRGQRETTFLLGEQSIQILDCGEYIVSGIITSTYEIRDEIISNSITLSNTFLFTDEDFKNLVLINLIELREKIENSEDDCWKNPNHKNTMLNKIDETIVLIENNYCFEAYDKILHDIKPKLTGLKTNENEESWNKGNCQGIFKNVWFICEDGQETFRIECNQLLWALNQRIEIKKSQLEEINQDLDLLRNYIDENVECWLISLYMKLKIISIKLLLDLAYNYISNGKKLEYINIIAQIKLEIMKLQTEFLNEIGLIDNALYIYITTHIDEIIIKINELSFF